MSSPTTVVAIVIIVSSVQMHTKPVYVPIYEMIVTIRGSFSLQLRDGMWVQRKKHFSPLDLHI